jgi:hypothetical protein
LLAVPAIGRGVTGQGIGVGGSQGGDIDSKQCGMHKNATKNRMLFLIDRKIIRNYVYLKKL